MPHAKPLKKKKIPRSEWPSFSNTLTPLTTHALWFSVLLASNHSAVYFYSALPYPAFVQWSLVTSPVPPHQPSVSDSSPCPLLPNSLSFPIWPNPGLWLHHTLDYYYFSSFQCFLFKNQSETQEYVKAIFRIRLQSIFEEVQFSKLKPVSEGKKKLFWEQSLDFELSPLLFFIINMSICHSAIGRTTFPSLAHETSLIIYCWCGDAKEARPP